MTSDDCCRGHPHDAGSNPDRIVNWANEQREPGSFSVGLVDLAPPPTRDVASDNPRDDVTPEDEFNESEVQAAVDREQVFVAIARATFARGGELRVHGGPYVASVVQRISGEYGRPPLALYAHERTREWTDRRLARTDEVVVDPSYRAFWEGMNRPRTVGLFVVASRARALELSELLRSVPIGRLGIALAGVDASMTDEHPHVAVVDALRGGRLDKIRPLAEGVNQQLRSAGLPERPPVTFAVQVVIDSWLEDIRGAPRT